MPATGVTADLLRRRRWLVAAAALVVVLVVIPGRPGDADVRNVQMTGISEAVQQATAWIDEIEAVQGVAEGRTADGRPCVDVYVTSATMVPEGGIPDRVGGFPVRVVDSGGPFQAQ